MTLGKLEQLLLILITLTSSTAFADSAPTVKPLGKRLQEARDVCYGRNWKKQKCVFQSPNNPSWNYERDLSDHLDGTALQLVKGISSTLKFLENYSSPVAACTTLIDPKKVIFEAFKSDLSIKAQELDLSSCQRSCLAKCMTSQLMKYDLYEESILYRSDFEVFCDGYGDCKEYSNLGETLQEAVGISSRTVSNWNEDQGPIGHSYLEVSLDGKAYYAEPQNPKCVFFKTSAKAP